MIDLFDRELVALLEQNANQRSEKLAKQLSVSSSTVRRRMQELIKRGVIHIVAIPDSKEIGFPLVTIVALQVQHEHINSITNTLKRREEVKYLYVTSGRFDIIACMWFSSTEQLYNFIEKDIPKIDGVKSSETFVCLHMEKSF